jgi:hypothetical protein
VTPAELRREPQAIERIERREKERSRVLLSAVALLVAVLLLAGGVVGLHATGDLRWLLPGGLAVVKWAVLHTVLTAPMRRRERESAAEIDAWLARLSRGDR